MDDSLLKENGWLIAETMFHQQFPIISILSNHKTFYHVWNQNILQSNFDFLNPVISKTSRTFKFFFHSPLPFHKKYIDKKTFTWRKTSRTRTEKYWKMELKPLKFEQCQGWTSWIRIHTVYSAYVRLYFHVSSNFGPANLSIKPW